MSKFIKSDNSDFTKEGYKLIDGIYEDMLARSRYKEVTDEELKEAVRELYRIGDEKEVEVEVLDSPIAVLDRVKELHGDGFQFGWYGNLSDFGWVADVMAGFEMGILKKDEEAEYGNFVRFVDAVIDSGIWGSVQTDKGAYCCRRPNVWLTDEEGNLHSTEGHAVEFKDGAGAYFIHGVPFKAEDFKKAMSAEAEDILGWEDVEQRSALLRSKGTKFLLEKCDAKLIDSTEEMGGYELYEIEVKGIGKTKLLKFKGWSTENEYTHFVNPEWTNALESAALMHNMTVPEFLSSVHS